MADISKELNTIRKGRFGIDIRQAIADAIIKINKEIEGADEDARYFARTRYYRK